MKLSILLSSAILFATALTPMSAYADDSNLMCRRSGCEAHNNRSGKLSISGLDINVKTSDRGNRNRNTAVNDKKQDVADNDHTNNNDVGEDNPVDSPNDTADIDNNNDNNNDNVVDADNGAGNDTDPVADNNSPPQLNSNDIKGFDPFGGLYGPGT